MKIQCTYCENFIEETERTCPKCGGTNARFRLLPGTEPITLEELKKFCKDHNVTPGKTHFYVGENHSGPKAFGIYQEVDTGNFVVYKNKSDGSRAVRYSGPDEARAVHEIFQKMCEIAGVNWSAPKSNRRNSSTSAKQGKKSNSSKANEQPQKKGSKKSNSNNVKRNGAYKRAIDKINYLFGGFWEMFGNGISKIFEWLYRVAIIAFVIFWIIGAAKDIYTYLFGPKYEEGYYYYDDNYYYTNGPFWYIYDDSSDDWDRTDILDPFRESYDEYGTTWEVSTGTDWDTWHDSDDDDDSFWSSSSSWDDDDDWGSSWDDDWGSSSSWDSYDDWDSDW